MSLELDPVELGFRRPFDREVEERLSLRNPNTDPVAFKVKTTAPKQYCVRPNSGRIEAGQTVDVSVLLQKMTEEPPLDAKCRDKFLVQSVAVSASDEISNVATVWQNIETNARSSIQEKKIRVNFLPASSSSTSNTTSNGAAPNNSTDTPNRSMLEDQPPAYSSPTAASGQTPQSINKYDTKDTTRGIDTDPAAHATSTSGTASSAGAGTVAAAANTVTAAVPTTSEELKTQLATAQEKISSLTAQANEGVRQRKNAASGSGGSGEGSGVGSGGLAMQQTAGGVPVPVVAGLCLLSFLLAYLLF